MCVLISSKDLELRAPVEFLNTRNLDDSWPVNMTILCTCQVEVWNACLVDNYLSIRKSNAFLLDFVCSEQLLCLSVRLFSKSNKMFFGYFDPEKIFVDNENKYFSG